jgi:alpha-L-arabinofuranosidase
MRKILFCALLLLFIMGTVVAQDEPLRVDAAQELGAISPYVYGANTGFAIIPPDLMPTAQALGLKYLRLGGGTSDQRPLDNLSIDILVAQARQMGAEPAVTVRLLGGTPEEAARWVEYANITKDYGIRYWSIGNEPNFFVAVLGADSYTTEDLNTQWRAIAEAMLAVDPDIMLVGPDISQYVVLNADAENREYLEGDGGGDPTDDLGLDWMEEFLKANGDLVDIVSIHRYPYPGAGGRSTATATVEGLRENVHQWDVFIPNLRQIIREAAGRDIPIAVTEFNSNSNDNVGGEASLDSHYNAIWTADVLGRLIRQQVEIVAYWNLGQRTTGFALIGQMGPRPAYYVYILYQQFGTQLLQASSPDPNVSIYAAKRDDGTVTLMVVNLGDEELTKTLSLAGFTPSGEAEVWRLDAEHNAEQLDSVELADGGSLTLPGQSVTLYVLPA